MKVLLKQNSGCEGYERMLVEDGSLKSYSLLSKEYWVRSLLFEEFKAQQVEAGLKIMLYNKFISI